VNSDSPDQKWVTLRVEHCRAKARHNFGRVEARVLAAIECEIADFFPHIKAEMPQPIGMPKFRGLIDDEGVSARSIWRAVVSLERRRIIEVTRTGRGPNAYRLLPPDEWLTRPAGSAARVTPDAHVTPVTVTSGSDTHVSAGVTPTSSGGDAGGTPGGDIHVDDSNTSVKRSHSLSPFRQDGREVEDDDEDPDGTAGRTGNTMASDPAQDGVDSARAPMTREELIRRYNALVGRDKEQEEVHGQGGSDVA
jgi:hypothetical protein